MTKIRKFLIIFLNILSFFLVFGGCVSNEQEIKSETKVESVQGNIIKVVGKAPDFNTAKMNAFKEACRVVVIGFIGEEQEKNNYKKLEKSIYSNPLKFIIEYKIIDKYTANNVVNVIMEVKPDIEKIKNVLISLGFNVGNYTPQSSTQGSQSQSSSQTAGQTGQNAPSNVATTKDDLFGVDDAAVMNAIKSMKPEEVEIIKRYVKSMIYMVYYEESKIKDNIEYFKFAVSRINNYFAINNIEYVDIEQINELKKDSEIVRLVTQGGVSELQLIADRIGADIYTVVDLKINTRVEGTKNIAQVNVTLKMFEAATGRGLGEDMGISDELYSTSSMDIAIRACIDNAIKKSMDKVVKMVQYKMFLSFKDGIRYKVVLYNVGSTKNRLEFEKAIQSTKGFRSFKAISATKDEAVYFVYYMGTLEEFELELFKILQAVPGFENFDEVLKRRNSVEFKI